MRRREQAIVTSSRVTAPGRLRFLPPELNLATRAVKKVANLSLPRDLFISHSNTSTLTPSTRHSTLNNRQAMAHGRPRARVHRHGAAPDAGAGPRDWRRSPDTRPGRTHLGKFNLFLIRVWAIELTSCFIYLQTELQRMMATINKINSETACAPDGMYVTDAAGNYVAKPGFFVRYPDQLSSYVAPTGNLGKAAPGTW